MLRLVTAFASLFLIAMLTECETLARHLSNDNPPSWVFDLKTLGYPTRPTRDFLEAFGLHPSTMAFVDSGHLALMYVYLDSGNMADRSTKPDSVKLRAHVVVLDANTGRVEASRDWPTPNMNDGVVVAHNGRFIIHRRNILTQYSTTLDVLKELDTGQGLEPHEWLSGVYASPTGGHILLEFIRSHGFQYTWMETEDLQAGPSFSDKFSASSISDEEIVGSKLELPSKNELVFRRPGSPDRVITFSKHGLRDVIFLNEGNLAIQQGYSYIQVIRADGTIIETIRPPNHDWFSRVTPSATGQRFAFTGSSIRNMLEMWEPQMQWEYVKRVMVYDLSAHQFVFNLKVKKSGQNDGFPLALSLDGSLLAFFDGTVLTVYRLPPTKNVGD